MSAFLQRPSFTLGEIRETTEQAVAAGLTLGDAAALREAGFEQHWRCGPDVGAFDLAERAVRELAHDLGSIDAIVYATCLPCNANAGRASEFARTRDVKHLMDFPASRLQAAFGLERAFVVGLDQQACTGMLGSLRLARALISAEKDVSRVLCVTADRFPEGALYEQSYNLISDGAAACVVTREPGDWEIVASRQITNGALSSASDDETVGSLFAYTARLVRETLAAAGIGAGELDWIVAQNTHSKAWQILARLLGFDFERVWNPTLAEVGHVISADNLINLRRLEDSGRVRPGQWALLVMAGYGLNWQSCLLRRRR